VRLLSRQDGRCSLCGENLLTPDQPPQSPQGWERWFLQVTRKAITADYLVHHDTPSAARNQRTHLVHATCHRSKHPPRTAGNHHGAAEHLNRPSGLLGPRARETCMRGPEGASVQQCTGATRPTRVSVVSRGLSSPRWPRGTGLRTSRQSRRVSAVSLHPAASGLQIGLQSRFPACAFLPFEQARAHVTRISTRRFRPGPPRGPRPQATAFTPRLRPTLTRRQQRGELVPEGLQQP